MTSEVMDRRRFADAQWSLKCASKSRLRLTVTYAGILSYGP